MKPRVLLKNAHDVRGFSEWYEGFPDLVMPENSSMTQIKKPSI